MKVVVIGAQGQLGQDLMKVLGDSATGLTHQDLDVTDGVAVQQSIGSLKPDWIINTAAFHRVDDCEANPALTMAVNAMGAFNVARAGAAAGARHVFLSTDYVYGGEPRQRGHALSEVDPPRPLNVYGISKAAGEQLVLHADPRALVIRSAGLYGTATSRKGWTFPELMLQLAQTQKVVKVVDDQVLSPTFTADLAHAIVGLMKDGASGLRHVANAGECSWYELAKATYELTGTQVDLQPQSTAETRRRATRPPYSALRSDRLPSPLRPWREALADYLQQKGRIPARTS
jgi:dTDP-4-dehydrorhamnose reductase